MIRCLQLQSVRKFSTSEMIIGGIGFASLSVGALIANAYKVSKPNEYKVKTGLGVDGVQVTKNAWKLPLQYVHTIPLEPENFTFNLQAMSSQKMEFELPGVFTIGPKDCPEALEKYATFLAHKEGGIHDLVEGIIEGETRVLAAQMTIEQIFNDRSKFKTAIISNIQDELDQFGLQVFNANIKELQDTPGSEYFQFLRQKTRATAEKQAAIDTKDQETQSRIEVSQLEAKAIEVENQNNQLIAQSNAELAKIQAESDRISQIAKIESQKFAELRETELQRDVDQSSISQITEKLRSEELSKATVYKETIELKAEADLTAEKLKAQGVLAMYQAQSKGIQEISESLGSGEHFLKYFLAKEGIYEKLAAQNAHAVHGMRPEIRQYNLGDASNNPLIDVMKMLPPLADTISDQITKGK